MAVTAALWVVATPGGEALRRGLLPLTSACSLLLIVGALLPGGPVAALARSRPLRWLGGISYAVYLVHWPVIVVANRLTIDRSTGRSVALVAISLALAQLTVVVVEHPIRRRRIVGRPLAVAATATLAIVAVSCRRRRSHHTVGCPTRRPGGRSSRWRRRARRRLATPPRGSPCSATRSVSRCCSPSATRR